MVSKFSMFLTSLQFSTSQFFPHRRQQIMEFLKEIAEDVPAAPFCEDILEIWLEEFGFSGLLWGNLALFGFGFLLMIVADILLCHSHNSIVQISISIMGALYCLFKFKSHQPATILLILLFVGFWTVCGFWWSLGFLFLMYFTNMGIINTQGR